MIVAPLNDCECLDAITARAREAVASPEAEQLARDLGSTAALRRHLRSLPQRDDTGEADDGPRIACGDTSQRVRLNAENPNCCERGLWFLAVAERIDPRPIRQLATIDTPRGRHTFPVEDGTPVRLDPAVPRNALAAGLYHIRNAQGDDRGSLLPGPAAVTWIAHLAAEPARQHPDGVARWTRGHTSMRAAARGEPLTNVADVAFVLHLAEPEADRFGPDGRQTFRRGMTHLRRASVATRDHRAPPTPARDHRAPPPAPVPAARDHRASATPVRPRPPSGRAHSFATFAQIATPLATAGLLSAGVAAPIAYALAPAIAPTASAAIGSFVGLARRRAR